MPRRDRPRARHGASAASTRLRFRNIQMPSKLAARAAAAAAVFVLAGGGAAALTQLHARVADDRRPSVVATRGDLADLVSAQGALEPLNYVDVGAQASGQIKSLKVAIGDRVKAGDILAALDPRIYEAQLQADTAKLANLRAELQVQQAGLRAAQITARRNRQLLADGAVSQATVDASDAALESAAASVRAAAAAVSEQHSQLSTDRTNLAYTRITAPMSGEIATLPVREGQTINASQQTPTILRVADLSVMTVRAQVAEADVDKLRLGMPVWFTTMGGGDRRWRGRVREIDPTPENENNVMLYDVLVDVRNPDRALLPGMTAQVFFERAIRPNTLVLPTAALARRSPGGIPATGSIAEVLVAGPRGPERRTLRLGLTTRTAVEVLQGLRAGERVIVPEPPSTTAAQPPGLGPRL
jgi:macrolide-specific efflux system membrane fusion protein